MRPTTLDHDLFDELESDPHPGSNAFEDEASPGCSDPQCSTCRSEVYEDGPVRADAERERALVMERIRAGVRDENELTNHIFFLRHPELPRRRLAPGQDALMREWKAIRRDVVRPALDALEPTGRDGPARRILLVGDSHTDGAFGAELERLLETTGASVTRAAKVGSAVKYWLPRLPALLRDHRPDVVIVALGANMRGYPSASGTSAHVRSAVQLIRKLRPSASIIWIGPPRQGDDTDATLQRFNDILKAGLGGARFIDSASHAPRYVGRDGVHYDARAARQWARGVFSELSGPSHELEDLLEDGDREDERDPVLESEGSGQTAGPLGSVTRGVSWGFDPRWTPLVFGNFAGGNRDRGKLTNLVFDAQGHAPRGHVITKAERHLAQKWIEARDNIVDPAINRLLNPTSAGTSAVVSPLATVSRFGLRANGGKRHHPIHGVLVHTTGSGPAVMANTGKSKWAGACSTPLDCALAIYAKNDGFPHYVIDYQGLIVAVCSEDHIAWHAGVGGAARAWLTKHGPPGWWKKVWGTVARSPFELPPSGRSPNQQYIGVELLGNEDDGTFTDAQYRSLAALIVDLEQRHRLALTQPPSRTLLGHEDVNPAPYQRGSVGGRSLDDLSAGWDPGASRGRFSWSKLWSLIRGGAPAPRPAAPAPAPSTPPPAPASTGSTTPPTDPDAYRKFRLTYYYVISQSDRPTGSVVIPFYDKNGKKIAEGSPGFFAGASLEGTGKLTDGRLINVDSTWIRVDPDLFAPVLEYHNKHLPGKPTSYSGVQVVDGRVAKAMAFHEIERSKIGIGYGMLRDIPLAPFRTLAADIGRMKRSEPRYKGKGGLVPPRTRVFIKEFVGVKLPDGTVHDGWFVVNDTGGAINGAHFDVFTGSRKLAAAVKIPSFGHVWFDGIESRIPKGYTYGLRD